MISWFIAIGTLQLEKAGAIGFTTPLFTTLLAIIFLGEIILDTELEYDKSFDLDLCGACTACIEACPTEAIFDEYQLDANKCISYLTIEHRNELPKK